MICPFCRQSDIMVIPGRTICPTCQTVVEIDDRGECIFADAELYGYRVDGLVCMVCGLIQHKQRLSFAYCGNMHNITVH
jgi:hypothetical protein